MPYMLRLIDDALIVLCTSSKIKGSVGGGSGDSLGSILAVMASISQGLFFSLIRYKYAKGQDVSNMDILCYNVVAAIGVCIGESSSSILPSFNTTEGNVAPRVTFLDKSIAVRYDLTFSNTPFILLFEFFQFLSLWVLIYEMSEGWRFYTLCWMVYSYWYIDWVDF